MLSGFCVCTLGFVLQLLLGPEGGQSAYLLCCVLYSASSASSPVMTTGRGASQFNFHFIVSAYGVDGGRGRMMLHLRPNCVVSFLLQKWGLQHLLMVHGAGSLSHLPNSCLSMAGSCGSLADVAWGASGLCRSSCHHPSSSAAPGRWQQACHWQQLPPGGGKLEVEAGSSHLPMMQMQDLSDAAAVWTPGCWEEEGRGRTVSSLPGYRCVTGGSWREDKWKGRISS